METVKGIGSHPVDLSDGRNIGPGEVLEDVSLTNAHNKALLDEGWIAVVVTEPPAEARPPKAEPDEALSVPAEPDYGTPAESTDKPKRPTGRNI